MKYDTIVKDGTLVTPQGMLAADLLVSGETIVGTRPHGESGDAETVVDADGLLVLPGIVDPHVHFSGPNTIDTYESGSRAAALGGVTSIVTFAWQAWDSPNTPWSEPGSLQEAVERQYKAAESSLIDFSLHATITQEDPAVLDELEALSDDGIVSFKIFTTYEFGLRNGFIEQVFEKLSETGAVAVLHTEDDDVCTAREAKMRRLNKGSPTDYPDSRPTHAEAMAVDDAVRMAENSGVKYYGIHTSSSDAAEVIEAAQTDKSKIRGETCVHYTTLSADAHAEHGNLPLIAPPLRTAADADVMFEKLKKGTLDVVSTDHVAFTKQDKQAEHWWDSEYGANSVQRSLPVFHDEAVDKRNLSYPMLVRLMSTNPARIFGLTNKGTLETGTDADFVIFDPNARQTITAKDNASRADFSVYEGREVIGAVEQTYLRGECIAKDGNIVTHPGYGEVISREIPDWEP